MAIKTKVTAKLSPEVAAALACGATVTAGEIETPPIPETPEVEAAAPADPAATTTPEVPAAPETPAAQDAPVAPVVSDGPLVAHLKEELAAARTELNTANTQIHELTGQVTTLNLARSADNVEGLTTIAREASTRLSVALGANAVGIDALSGNNLVQMYARLNEEFGKRFVSGGKARVLADSVPARDATVEAQSGAARAAVAATRLSIGSGNKPK